jgi:hypothetical protein
MLLDRSHACTTQKTRPGSERRVTVRYLCERDEGWRFLLSESGELALAQLLDVSTDGLRLRLDRAFQPGTRLIIALRRDRNVGQLCKEVQVVHALEAADWSWELGCAFTGRLAEAEVQDLL